MSFVFLIAALLGLGLGPLVFALLHRTRSPQLALDGFVLVAVVGLVLLHVVPHALHEIGAAAVFVLLGGIVLPIALERARALSSATSHAIVLGLALGALVLHTSLDGVGLASAGEDVSLGLAIVLHQLPVGLALWWLVRPQFGRRWATAVLVALGLATIGGYVVGEAMFAPFGHAWVQYVQVFVAGSLLHVLMHQSVGFHDHGSDDEIWHIPGAIGALLGAVVVALVPGADEHNHFGEHLADVVFAAAPLLVALFGAGVLAVRLRQPQTWRATVLHVLDRSAPLAAMSLGLAAFVGAELDIAANAAHWAGAVAFGALVCLSLFHQGPREFLLRVVPLGRGGHDHHHEHHQHEHRHHEHRHEAPAAPAPEPT